MKVLHLSPRYNRDSILHYGVQPTKVKSKNHAKAFQKEGLIRDENDGLIYTWEDCIQNDKFARDLIYAITWIHPRNEREYPEDFDFKDFHLNPIYPYDQMIFDLYVGETYDREFNFLHEQRSMDRDWTSYGMDEKYEHNDKKLHILQIPLEVKPVGEFIYRFDKERIIIK